MNITDFVINFSLLLISLTVAFCGYYVYLLIQDWRKVLRQTSIDEFPQVFNILLGTMSLIGPRPVRDVEIADAIKRYGVSIKKDIDLALTAKPGLSGPWQVSGRNDIPWDKRLKIDADYARNRSLLRDFSIILKTPLAMISKW